VAKNEEGYRQVCREMSHLFVGEGRAPETFRYVATLGHTSLEMGKDHDGFSDEITQDQEGP
jgi:hypothetical protein